MKSFLITSDRGSTRRLESLSSRVTVGRGDHNDIVLTGPGVSWDHGYFVIEGDAVSYVDKSRNGSNVNGELVNNAGRRLSGGDVVELWGEQIQLLGGDGRAVHAPTAVYREPETYRPEKTYRPPRQEPPPQNIQQHIHVASPPVYDPAIYKSYVGWSFLVLILYLFLWPLGLILNIVFLVEAGDIKRRTNVAPGGHGCLWALLIWSLISVVIGVLLIIFIFGALGSFIASLGL